MPATFLSGVHAGRLFRGVASCLLAVTLGMVGCDKKSVAPLQERGQGMPVASLTVAEQVAVYDKAVRAAFDVGPELVLRLHPDQLPPTGGFDGGTPVPQALGAALLARGVTQGVCTPVRSGGLRAPLCKAERSGYVVRGSQIFQAGADTIQFYLLSELYAASAGSGQEPFSFEMAYRLVPDGKSQWRVVAEGRVRQKGDT